MSSTFNTMTLIKTISALVLEIRAVQDEHCYISGNRMWQNILCFEVNSIPFVYGILLLIIQFYF